MGCYMDFFLFAVIVAAMMVVFNTFVHYEVLSTINIILPRLRMPHRAEVGVVILGAFVAHALEISIYGLLYWASMTVFNMGTLQSSAPLDLLSCLYFSAETFTSLGFGDITPAGPLRLIAAVEALNGLLLIAWSASFTYLSMERYWVTQRTDRSTVL